MSYSNAFISKSSRVVLCSRALISNVIEPWCRAKVDILAKGISDWFGWPLFCRERLDALKAR